MKRWALQRNQSSEQAGFTIVELLIVIVVIGILAAISIVAYNGIQARGKTSAAQASAVTVAKKAELYNTEVGNYPLGMTALTGAASTTSYNVSSIVYVGTLTNDTSTNSVVFYVCGSGSPASAAAITASNVTGGRIYYRDYQTPTNRNEAYGVVSGTGIACYGRN